MKNFIKQQREVLILILYVGVVAGFVFLVINPLIKAVNDSRDEIQKEVLSQEYKKKSLDGLPKMEKQYVFLSENANTVNVLLEKNNAVTLIERLEKVAEASGNGIAISVADKQEAPKQVEAASKKGIEAPKTIASSLPSNDYLQIKIALTGTYNSVMNFIDALQKLEYYSDTIAIQIYQKKDDQGQLSQIQNVSSDPFSRTNSTENSVKQPNKGDVEASLDVIFYTKK